MTTRSSSFTARSLAIVVVCVCFYGCAQKMNDDPKYEPYTSSDLFEDGSSVRVPPAGTVARVDGSPDFAPESGRSEGGWIDGFPFAITRERMERGRKSYNVFCSPCHGATGDGEGMIVKRGLRGPVTFHEPRFRSYPTGYFFEVITNGRGGMYPYGSRIPPLERWEIIAYIRALQLSQNAPLNVVPPTQRDLLAASEAP